MDHLATITPYAAGATIKDLVNSPSSRRWRRPDHGHLGRLLRPSWPRASGHRRAWSTSNGNGTPLPPRPVAVIGHLVQTRNVIDAATMQKGADYLGFVKPIPDRGRFTSWRSEYEADIMVSLASLVGERMFFNGDRARRVG